MMRLYRIVILCLILVCLLIVGKTFIFADNDCAYAQNSSVEDSSKLIINNFSDLASVATEVNSGKFDGYYGTTIELACDLDVKENCQSFDSGTGWIPIGTTTYPFKGTFDGKGHSIVGLYINKVGNENVGLFGAVSTDAIIRNLTLQGLVTGGNYTGGIVGYSQALVENCTSLVTISSQDDSLHIGGITGYNLGKVSQSKNYGEIYAGYSTFVGGMAGSNTGVIEKCYNAGNIVSSNSVVGGIVGNNAGNIEVCINIGRIVGKSSVGGIVGNNQGLVNNTLSKCQIDSVDGVAGGIAGSNENIGIISYAMSICKVKGLNDVASICGYNMGVVTNAFYDECISSRIVVNGMVAENSKGLPTRIIIHEDALIADEKLLNLVAGNESNWIKRKSDGSCYYYPELKYFYENEYSLSTQVCEGNCLEVHTDDIFLEETNFIYNGEGHEIVVKLNDLQLELGLDYIVSYTDNLNSGNQSASIEFLGMYTGVVNKGFNILKSLLEVQWKNLIFLYDGRTHSPELEIVSGLVGNDGVKFEYSTTVAKNAGEYEIVADLASNVSVNNNYEIPATKAEYRILQAPLTIGWSNEKFIYNGQVQIPSASVLAGNVDNEKITINYEYFENIKAGEQSIIAYLADTEINANYLLNAEEHKYFIGKKIINVIWDNETLYYNGSAQYPKVSEILGVINDDSIELEYYKYLNNINADEYNEYQVFISLSNTEINNNYALSNVVHNYSIHKAMLTIDWWDTPLFYNGMSQCPNYYIKSGIIGNDEVVITVLDYSNNINACVGNAYNVKIALADNPINSNYMLSETTKNYGIRKADFITTRDVVFNSKIFEYDGKQKNIFIENALPNGVVVEYENNGKVDIGQYTVVAKFSVDTQNYNPLAINTLSATMSIAQMVFEDEESKIILTNKGEVIYGLTININKLKDSTFKQKGKKLLAAYSSSFPMGVFEYRIPLGEIDVKDDQFHILYKTESGEIVNSNFIIEEGYVVFTVEDAIELAIFADMNLTWLWISIGCSGFLVVLLMILILISKRRQLSIAQIDDVDTVDNKEMEQVENLETNTDYITEEAVMTIIDGIVVNKEKPFYLDGVYCLSYDWFIKSLNVKTIIKQERICGGDHDAELLIETLSHNSVYWQGKRYRINSKSYEELIRRAKEASNENN